MDSSNRSLYSFVKISKMLFLAAFEELFTAISNAHLTIIPRLSLETYKKRYFNPVIIINVTHAIFVDSRHP